MLQLLADSAKSYDLASLVCLVKEHLIAELRYSNTEFTAKQKIEAAFSLNFCSLQEWSLTEKEEIINTIRHIIYYS